MPGLFLYHTVIMTKPIKPTIWRDHTNLIINGENSLVVELRVLVEKRYLKGKHDLTGE
ncbi:hypothetical protein BD310DRAFT_981877 [Dichomitus squalens]|uniref:Uncharacterized protein n=1 Tax=Dichomitus squalens TaxID=114155 RepID=A0A4Q9PCB0_9APHY|nr:hypothetical protein BD310DRAFT_981877 [Dichomitus squalens]